MAKHSITLSAKLAGVSRSHFYKKFINTGIITVETQTDGKKAIDSAEIQRVFGLVTAETVGDVHKKPVEDTSRHHENTIEFARLRNENEVLRQTLGQLREHVRWQQQHIDKLTGQVDQTLRQIEYRQTEHDTIQRKFDKAQASHQREIEVFRLNEEVIAEEAQQQIDQLRENI